MKNSKTKNKRFNKFLAVFLAIQITFQGLFPMVAMALTSGPSQPESTSFEPVGTSEMVDVSSGDFTYNIPLLDVGGYPVNISYHGGISMDQEASWVGLGWNINAGSITRNMRGLPDDFNGDNVTKEITMKPQRNYAVTGTFGGELMNIEAIGLHSGLGITYNNYRGMGMEIIADFAINSGKGGKGSFDFGLGITSSSTDGLSISPSITYEGKINEKEKAASSMEPKIGFGFNTRSGMSNLAFTIEYDKNSKSKLKWNDPNKRTSNANGSTGVSFDPGMPSYTPSIGNDMQNVAVTFSGKWGGTFFGADGTYDITGSYSSQNLIKNTINQPAYGYLNTNQAPDPESGTKTLLDFNREKDGSYSKNVPHLALTNYTYDIFSVSGQGVGGSFRPFKNEIKLLNEAENKILNNSFSFGAEFGTGNTWKGGVDFNITNVNGKSGQWKESNDIYSYLSTKNFDHDFTFKEAGEKNIESDESFIASIGDGDPINIELEKTSGASFEVKAKNKFIRNDNPPLAVNDALKRKNPPKRNQLFSYNQRRDLSLLGLEQRSGLYATTNIDHHIAEITTTKTDGTRYIYGIAAYNTTQEEIGFSVEYASNFNDVNPNTGSVSYADDDITLKNKKGLDNYYSNTIIPAYAHSYLLTAIISPDYVDIENKGEKRGPSDGDFGTYTKFNYTKTSSNFKWRVPFPSNSNFPKEANFNEGLKSDNLDDKGTITYGEKELWYLQNIETKTHVAFFELGDREDGLGVMGKSGGRNTAVRQKYLKKISLYSKSDVEIVNNIFQPKSNAIPIKEIHFEYNYSLCPDVPNNTGTITSTNNNQAKGKLTLKKIYFTFGKSTQKAALSPYVFTYSSQNHHYNLKNSDRWGSYIANSNFGKNYNDMLYNDPLEAGEFPYTTQDPGVANLNAESWSLKEILLPSGGIIKVDYECDDYAYVQNKPAMQMFKILGCGEKWENFDLGHNVLYEGSLISPDQDNDGVGDLIDPSTDLILNGDRSLQHIKGDNILNLRRETIFYIKLDAPVSSVSELQNKYFKDNKIIFFNFFMNLTDFDNDDSQHNFDFVKGYGELEDYGLVKNASLGYSNGKASYGWIRLKNVCADNSSNCSAIVCPVVKAAAQFGRFQTPHLVYSYPRIKDENSKVEDMLKTLIGTAKGANLLSLFENENQKILNKGFCSNFVTNKSWVRLYNPNKHKKGGGHRVKKIIINDNWANMGSGASTQEYGQLYDYNLPDGSSSGVASYEPAIGNDENSWKQPIPYGNKKENWLKPNDDFYQETPVGESFFPSPSVIYSRVTVRNLKPKDFDPTSTINVNRHGTGSVVYEFYTAKDFPTITKQTNLTAIKRGTGGIGKVLGIVGKDYMTASEGFVIENNDMHGKSKSQTVYPEAFGQNLEDVKPISKVTTIYKSEKLTLTDNVSPDDYKDCFHLINLANVITPEGNVYSAQIGVNYDMVTDMREHSTVIQAGGIHNNLVSFIIGPLFGAVPLFLPSYSYQKTRFRSAAVTKVIQRFGLIEKVEAYDLGSVVTTENLAYDSESGEVLATKTQNNFDDAIYNLSYPAYWFYKNMGPAYANQGLEMSGLTFTNGSATINDAFKYFNEGDELVMYGNSAGKYWVTKVTDNSITVMDYSGVGPTISIDKLKVLRSGRRNLQSQTIGGISSLSNPLDNFRTNVFNNVLQSNAIVYTDQWKTWCECFNIEGGLNPSYNPFVNNLRGNYRPKKGYTYLSDRAQTNNLNNSNIRKDGVFTSYSPYWKLVNGKWVMDEKSWTWNSEVSEFDPQGAELENKDALNRFSAAQFSYGEKLATAVAANSRYTEMGVDNFEDYDYINCNNNHFSFKKGSYKNESGYGPNNTIVLGNEGHSGKKSVKVGAGKVVTLTKNLENCNTCRDITVATLAAPTTTGAERTFTAPTVTTSINSPVITYLWQVNGSQPIGSSTGSSFRIMAQNKSYRVTLIIKVNDCTITKTYLYKYVQ